MPFETRRQQRFMYANKSRLEKQGVDVDEWASKTDFKHLPEHAAKKSEFLATEFFKTASPANLCGCDFGFVASTERELPSATPALDYFKLAHKLDAAERKHIAPGSFALPGRRYPIEDESHARNALARASGKSVEGAVRAAVHAKYPGIGKEASVAIDDAFADAKKVERLQQTPHEWVERHSFGNREARKELVASLHDYVKALGPDAHPELVKRMKSLK